jgi:hypothetical protein
MRRLAQKPLSLLVAFLGLFMIIYALYGRWGGNIYVARLNYIDGTTLIMVALLLLRAVIKLNDDSDLQTVSIGLISAVSFVFAYEMIYKWSFFFFPWRMPPEELREFIIQISVSLVVIAGFSQGIFHLRVGSKIALVIFAVGWLIWLAVGFPQLVDGKIFYVPLVEIPFSGGMIYALNRLTKIALFLFYFLLYT